MRTVEFVRVDSDRSAFHRAGDPIVIGEVEYTADVKQDGVEWFRERHRPDRIGANLGNAHGFAEGWRLPWPLWNFAGFTLSRRMRLPKSTH